MFHLLKALGTVINLGTILWFVLQTTATRLNGKNRGKKKRKYRTHRADICVPAVTLSATGHPRKAMSGEGQMCTSGGEVRFTLLALTGDVGWCCIPGKYVFPTKCSCSAVTSEQKLIHC